MPTEKRLFTKGMNKDKDYRFLENGEYLDALNIRVTSNTEGGSEGAVVKIKEGLTLTPSDGNTIPTSSVCVGVLNEIDRNLVYFFFVGSSNTCTIWEYNIITKYFRRILSNSNLGFEAGTIILGIKLIDDNLVWADPAGEMKTISVTRAILGLYDNTTTFEERALTLYAEQPTIPPIAFVSSDPFYTNNNIYGKYFQFAYRWVYWDNRKSSWSTESKAVLNYRATIDSDITKSGFMNKVVVKVRTPERPSSDTSFFCKGIEVAVRDVSNNNSGLWKLMREIELSDLDDDIVQYNEELIIDFYNDKVYPSLDQGEVAKLFDYIPRSASDLQLSNENRLVFSNCLFDYNLFPEDGGISGDYQNTKVEATPRDLKSASATVTLTQSAANKTLTVTGLPSISALGNNPVVTVSDGTVTKQYAVYVSSHLMTLDDFNLEIKKMIEKGVANGYFNSTLATGWNYGDGGVITISSVLGTFSAVAVGVSNLNEQPEQSHSRLKAHPFGIVYYDKFGRVTGVYKNENMTMTPEWFDGAGSTNGRVDAKITIDHLPIAEATSFGIVYAKPRVATNTITLRADFGQDTFEFSFDTTTVTAGSQVLLSEPSPFIPEWPIKFTNIGGLTGVTVNQIYYPSANENGFLLGFALTSQDAILGNLVSITGSAGTATVERAVAPTERTRLVFETAQNNITDLGLKYTIPYDKSYVVQHVYDASAGDFVTTDPTDYKIVDTGSNYVEIQGNVTAIANDDFVRLFYDGDKINDFVYYEIGERYPITNGYHTPTDSSTWTGIDYSTLLGNQDQTGAQPAIIYVYGGDLFYKSAESNVEGWAYEVPQHSPYYNSFAFDIGRLIPYNQNYKETIRSVYLGFTEPYLYNSYINGLATAYDTAFKELDQQFGAIQKIWYDERTLFVVQESKAGVVLVGKDVVTLVDGTDLQVDGDKYFSDINYRTKDYGIGVNPESFATYGGQKYWVDPVRLAVCRDSDNGITDIADKNMKSYFAEILTQAISGADTYTNRTTKIFGAYDRRNREYVIMLRQLVANTIYIGDDETGTDIPVTIIGANYGAGDGVGQIVLYTSDGRYFGTYELAWDEIGEFYYIAGLPSTVFYTTMLFYPSNPQYKNVVIAAYSDVTGAWTTFYDYGEDISDDSDSRLDFLSSVGVDLLYTKRTISSPSSSVVLIDKGTNYLTGTITAVGNAAPSAQKVYTGISEEVEIYGTDKSKWIADEDTITDAAITNPKGQKTYLRAADLTDKEGFYYAPIYRDINTPNVTNPELEGDNMRDNVIVAKLYNTDTDNDAKLFAVNFKYIGSNYINK